MNSKSGINSCMAVRTMPAAYLFHAFHSHTWCGKSHPSLHAHSHPAARICIERNLATHFTHVALSLGHTPGHALQHTASCISCVRLSKKDRQPAFRQKPR